MNDAERSEQREHVEMRLQVVEALVLATSRRTEVLEAVARAEDAESAVRDLLGVGVTLGQTHAEQWKFSGTRCR